MSEVGHLCSFPVLESGALPPGKFLKYDAALKSVDFNGVFDSYKELSTS